MVLTTAKAHFDDDISRASALYNHAMTLQIPLKEDILRSSLMFTVGACDAYFCDAYTDLISRVLRAKESEPTVVLPDRINNLRLPVCSIIHPAANGWRWRMAARELMEDENVLSLEKIRKLFNHFFETGNKIINEDTIGQWINHKSSKQRLFGISKTKFNKAIIAPKNTAKKDALRVFESVFHEIFQRRHDCIHNCDRPKVMPQPINEKFVQKKIEDVVFLVERCHEAFSIEFSAYLLRAGFSNLTISQVSI